MGRGSQSRQGSTKTNKRDGSLYFGLITEKDGGNAGSVESWAVGL